MMTSTSSARWARMRELAARGAARCRVIASAARQVVGIPDYGRYLQHMATRHPDAPVLTRAQFVRCALDAKYRGKGPRCC